MKSAEKGLIWALIHNSEEALQALEGLGTKTWMPYQDGRYFEVARGSAQSIRRIFTLGAFAASKYRERPARHKYRRQLDAARSAPDCARAIKRLRCERERAAIQREIDRLQELGAGQHGHEIDALWQRKKNLLHRIEELT